MTRKNLVQAEFHSEFVSSLTGDPNKDNRSRQTPNVLYTLVDPTPVTRPRLIAWSSDIARVLDLSDPRPEEHDAFARILAGNHAAPGMRPYAARYGGHQFGHWAGQLGDGRAITLGELKPAGGGSWEVQLKGAGPTPYSRGADGRAVLRSSLREFVCSEAMHHLGIPTTRALALVATGDNVTRDMFYDGNPVDEPGAITTRVAPSFARFGNFEILADNQEDQLLRSLADFTISRHFPELETKDEDRYGKWFDEICRRTARLVVQWQRVGFVHGVMNTDNMSVLGLTIDYGPYGWLEGFDPMWTPNTTDARGRRYCYGRQPQIAYWNLQRLARAIAGLPLSADPSARLNASLELFERTFADDYRQMLADKLGLRSLSDRGDFALAQDFFESLGLVETDMTIAFRSLMALDPGMAATSLTWRDLRFMSGAFYNADALTPADQHKWSDWFKRYLARLGSDPLTRAERAEVMGRANPNFVPRNYLTQGAIDEITETGRATKLHRLLDAATRPYDNFNDQPDLIKKRPEWARNRPGCSALSCSS